MPIFSPQSQCHGKHQYRRRGDARRAAVQQTVRRAVDRVPVPALPLVPHRPPAQASRRVSVAGQHAMRLATLAANVPVDEATWGTMLAEALAETDHAELVTALASIIGGSLVGYERCIARIYRSPENMRRAAERADAGHPVTPAETNSDVGTILRWASEVIAG